MCMSMSMNITVKCVLLFSSSGDDQPSDELRLQGAAVPSVSCATAPLPCYSCPVFIFILLLFFLSSSIGSHSQKSGLWPEGPCPVPSSGLSSGEGQLQTCFSPADDLSAANLSIYLSVQLPTGLVFYFFLVLNLLPFSLFFPLPS